MASCPDELLEEFEAFQVDEILSEVKKEWVLDRGVTQFGEELEERARLKQAAQAARATYVKQHWTPGHYPQLTTGWFIEGLDFCCDYWRYEFKRPLTSAPAPPPCPDASQKKKQTCRFTCHGTKRRPTTDQENDNDFDELTELRAKEERRRAQPRASRARYPCDRTFA